LGITSSESLSQSLSKIDKSQSRSGNKKWRA